MKINFVLAVFFQIIFAASVMAQSCPTRTSPYSCTSASRSVDSMAMRINLSYERLEKINELHSLAQLNARLRYEAALERVISSRVTAQDRCEYQLQRNYSNLSCYNYYYFYDDCQYRIFRIQERYYDCLKSASMREENTKRNLERNFKRQNESLERRLRSQLASAELRNKRDSQRLADAQTRLADCQRCQNQQPVI